MKVEVEKLIPLLESAHFADRSRGSEILNTMDDRESILAFHAYAELNDNDGLRLSLQKLLFRLLKREQEDLCGLALSILLAHACLPNKGIRQESEKLIDEFLNSTTMFQYLKFLAIKKAWKHLGPEQRSVATKKIGSFQLREVVTLLLENFHSGDERLLLLTMEVFKRLRDKRANRYIREIIQEKKSPALVIKALGVLSELGYFMDQRTFVSFLDSETEEIRLTAMEGLHALKKDRALRYVKDFFRSSTSDLSKTRVIELLSKNPTKASVVTLLELWQSEDFSSVEHKIEWALNELEGPQKLDAILAFYPRANEILELKIIALLNELNHPKCYDFYYKLISQNKNEFLTMSAMEAIAYYDDPRTLPLLRPFLNRPEEMLHYYALAAYVKHTGVDLTSLLEETIALGFTDDRHHHQLILNVLREQNGLASLSQKLREYVLKMMSSKQRDNRYLGYAVLGRFHHEFNLQTVLASFLEEKNELVLKEGYGIFAQVFSKDPVSFVKSLPTSELFNTPAFYQKLQPTLEIIWVLLSGNHKDAILHLQKQQPLVFWKFVMDLLEAKTLGFGMITWLDLTGLDFDDFLLIWGQYHGDRDISLYLLKSLSLLKDPRFGDFILEEYLKSQTHDLSPYVSRFVNGLP